jgi:hypothetical protein
MAEPRERGVRVTIVATKKRCDRRCPYSVAHWCRLFREQLAPDLSRPEVQGAHLRLQVCRDAEGSL